MQKSGSTRSSAHAQRVFFVLRKNHHGLHPPRQSRRHVLSPCLSLALASLILANVLGKIIYTSPFVEQHDGWGWTRVSTNHVRVWDKSPCHRRILDLFRQRVRKECREEVAEYCDGGDETDAVARGLNYKLDSMSDEYLTMYSLFYHPDESVMVYTRPLGFSDDRVDECMMTRHASEEFGRGCTLCGGECYDTMNASTLTLSSGGSRITLLGLGLGSGCRSCYDTMNAFLMATTDRTLNECMTTDRTLVVGGIVAHSRSFAPPPPPPPPPPPTPTTCQACR